MKFSFLLYYLEETSTVKKDENFLITNKST